jgi:hypothetical protein
MILTCTTVEGLLREPKEQRLERCSNRSLATMVSYESFLAMCYYPFMPLTEDHASLWEFGDVKALSFRSQTASRQYG